MATLKASKAVNSNIRSQAGSINNATGNRAVTAASHLIKAVIALKYASFILVGVSIVAGAVVAFRAATGAASGALSIVPFVQAIVSVVPIAAILFQVEKMLADAIEHDSAFTQRQPARLRIIAAWLLAAVVVSLVLSLVVGILAGDFSFSVSLGVTGAFPAAGIWESALAGAATYETGFQVVLDLPGLLLCVCAWCLSYVFEDGLGKSMQK